MTEIPEHLLARANQARAKHGLPPVDKRGQEEVPNPPTPTPAATSTPAAPPPMTPPDDPAHQMAEAIMQMTAVLAPIMEAVNGYRVHLVADGWSQEHAQSMAAEYQRLIIAQIIAGLTKSSRS